MSGQKYTEKTLAQAITARQFSRVESVFRRHFGLGLETLTLDGRAVKQMCSADCCPQFCEIVRGSKSGMNRCLQDRLRSLNIAFETGQPYICLCHAGIVLVCVPVMDRNVPLGGLFFGKCLWEEPGPETDEDILNRLRGVRVDEDEIITAAHELPVVSSRKIHSAAEFLFILLYEVTNLDPMVIKWRRRRSRQQSRISEMIHEFKKFGISRHYPYDSERRLIEKVRIGEATGTEELLNSIVGYVMYWNPGEMNILKARLLELLGVLSRAAADGGADINALLARSLAYTTKIMGINTQEDLCAWVGSALTDFTDTVYAAKESQRAMHVKPARDFIEAHYRGPLSVADVAKAVHLSESRLSHLFKEHTGVTVVDYLTEVRIARAKELLLGTAESCTKICFDVGYNSQSYFARRFKEIVGITPKEFRETNRRPTTAAGV